MPSAATRRARSPCSARAASRACRNTALSCSRRRASFAAIEQRRRWRRRRRRAHSFVLSSFGSFFRCWRFGAPRRRGAARSGRPGRRPHGGVAWSSAVGHATRTRARLSRRSEKKVLGRPGLVFRSSRSSDHHHGADACSRRTTHVPVCLPQCPTTVNSGVSGSSAFAVVWASEHARACTCAHAAAVLR